MRLTTFTDYSLRILMYLATAPEGRATTGEIARAFGISQHHLVKVAQRLGQAGLLVNTRGRGGGVRLAVAPGMIRLGGVVRATEGHDVPAECFEPGGSACVIAQGCTLQGVLAEAVSGFYEVLDRYTVTDLVTKPSPAIVALHRSLDRGQTTVIR